MEDEETLQRIYSLVRENNKMLHSMRREAFLGWVVKILFYAAFVIVPLWAYYSYLAPALQPFMQSMQQASNTGQNIQIQLSGWQKTLNDLQHRIPGFSTTTGQ